MTNTDKTVSEIEREMRSWLDLSPDNDQPLGELADLMIKKARRHGGGGLLDNWFQKITDALASRTQEPAEWQAVPQKMRMDGDAAKAIAFMLGSADEDDDTPLDAILWVGDLGGDDGKPVHGLHLANAEYPEEGSITLVEFEALRAASITPPAPERSKEEVGVLSVADAVAQLTAAVEAEKRRNAVRDEMLATVIVNLEKSEMTAEFAVLLRDYVRTERAKLAALSVKPREQG